MRSPCWSSEYETVVYFHCGVYKTFLPYSSLATVLKSYGTQLKAPAAMVRLRLFETLTLLPPTVLEASYTHLLRMLVSEFTLSDNAANTTNSLLRTLCHGDDSIILGTWLQETNHRTIEDQVGFIADCNWVRLDLSLCMYTLNRILFTS